MESQENKEESNHNEYPIGNKMLLHKLNTTSPSNISEIMSSEIFCGRLFSSNEFVI